MGVSWPLFGRGISCGRLSCGRVPWEMVSIGGLDSGTAIGSGLDGGKGVCFTASGAAGFGGEAVDSFFARASFCCFVTSVIFLKPVVILSSSSPDLAGAGSIGLDDLGFAAPFVAGPVFLFCRGALGASFLVLVVLVFLTASGPPVVVLTLMDVSGLSVIDVAGRSSKGAPYPAAPSRDSRMVDAALTRRPCLVGARSPGCGVLLRDGP